MNITLLCLDVDGVMTDGSIMLDDHGVETKRFHVRDGAGIRMWLTLGYHVAIITGRSGDVVKHRARELGIEHVIQGSKDKGESFRQLMTTLDLQPEHAAMIGDDIPDLPLLRMVGYPIAVADAAVEVRDLASYVTNERGGHGAVREAIEHLLNKKGQWQQAVEQFEVRQGTSG